MHRNMIKTFIYLIVLTLFTVHSKAHFRKESGHHEIALKSKFYNQISMKVLIHIFTKIGFSSDIQYLITTLNRPCRRVKKEILRKLKKNIMKIKHLQQAKKEFMDSLGMMKMIEYILLNLQDCKRIRKGNKKMYRKIKQICLKIRHLEKNKKHQKKDIKPKVNNKSTKITKRTPESLFNNCSNSLPKNVKTVSGKIEILKRIEKLSKKCIYLKKLCKHKGKQCKKSKSICKAMKNLIELSN